MLKYHESETNFERFCMSTEITLEKNGFMVFISIVPLKMFFHISLMFYHNIYLLFLLLILMILIYKHSEKS